MIFLAGMQSLAVTTVMPIVSADLDGAALYAVAFAGPLATSVIGMVAVGAWSDRSGPLLPLTAAVALFVAGLVLAGAASSMEVLVVGRLVQGLGTGGQTVALYVVVARVYPPALHGRVFAAFSAAWVVPSLIGPFLAGVVTEYLHWRWVFFGIAALTTVAYAVVALRLRGTPMHTDTPSTARIGPRLACAVAVAAGALALSLAGALGAWAWLVVAASALVIGVASRPLLPRGTLRAARGLPSVILMRGLIAGALFGAEIYVPYLLIDDYGFSPTWAGLGLTAAALAWAVAADVQGRFGDRLGNTRITLIGTGLLTAAMVIAAATAALHLPAAVVISGWALAGGGMGLMYPRLTVLTLAYSTPQDQGFNSSALSIADSIGAATSIAVMGLVFTALVGTDAGFPAVFVIATVLALVALVPGLRLGHAHESRRTRLRDRTRERAGWSVLGSAEPPVAHERDRPPIDSLLGDEMPPQRLDRAGLAGEPRVERRALERGAALRGARHLPEDVGVDVDLGDLRASRPPGASRAAASCTCARRGGRGAGRRRARRRGTRTRVLRKVRDVVLVRHLEDDRAARVGGELLEDDRDGGRGGLVAGEEERVGLCGRHEVDAVADPRVRGGRGEDQDLIADRGARDPG